MDTDSLTLDIEQHIVVTAPIAKVFDGLLKRLSEKNTKPSDEPMPMVLERWPGGRWFRDLGHKTGHLWGFVQVIKPPTLLEICGPMFMSYPVAGHLRLALEEDCGRTRVSLHHRAIGLIDPDHRRGVVQGWEHCLQSLKRDCQTSYSC